jgi:hypothetical protein
MSKRFAGPILPVEYFINRSRTQKLYRNFLRICETKEERIQVRQEFQNKNKKMSFNQAETILKSLRLAREKKSNVVVEAEQGEGQGKVEWPWQREEGK